MEAELSLTSELLAGLFIGCHQIIILRSACKCLKIQVCFGSIMTLTLYHLLKVIFFASRDKHQEVRLFVPTQLCMYIISIAYYNQVCLNRRDEGK